MIDKKLFTNLKYLLIGLNPYQKKKNDVILLHFAIHSVNF